MINVQINKVKSDNDILEFVVGLDNDLNSDSLQTFIEKETLNSLEKDVVEAFAIYQTQCINAKRELSQSTITRSEYREKTENATKELTDVASNAYIELIEHLDSDESADRVGSFINQQVHQNENNRGRRIDVHSHYRIFPFELLYVNRRNELYNPNGFLGSIFEFIHWPAERKGRESYKDNYDSSIIKRGGLLNLYRDTSLTNTREEQVEIGKLSPLLSLSLKDRSDVVSNERMRETWNHDSGLNEISHFACHHENDSDTTSYLQLSNGYKFRPRNLHKIDPPRPRPLVYLSTCKGLGHKEHLVSLVKSFYPKFSKGIVASFVPIADCYAVEIAKTFYGHLSSPSSVTAALTKTKNELIGRGIPEGIVSLAYTSFCTSDNLMLEDYKDQF